MKPLFIISCPIDTYSGYGARSRDIVKSLIELDQYDIKVLPQRWGNTPWGFINDHPEEWEFLSPHLLPSGNHLPTKPKIWAQITVPNEFQPVGDYNIGFTAGIETTICDPSWIEGLNRMDLNIVSSEHAKTTFENSNFTEQDQKGNNLRDIFVKKPIEVLFEGADLNTYFPQKSSKFNLSDIKEQFAYLFVGHWMQGSIGEDRKNTGLLLKLFYETFKDQENPPALILKSSVGGASYMDREAMLDRIHQVKSTVDAKTLPNVYLIHGDISNKEMNELYNHKKVKVMVSLTKGEGFGRPLLEFSLTKKPIITTNWSGHIDFLDSKYTTLINGELKNVDKSAAIKNMILEESKWFSPDTQESQQYLHDTHVNYKKYEKKALLQYHKSKNNFSYEGMKDLLGQTLEIYLPEFPHEVRLNLPKLDLPKLNSPSLSLPNLKDA